MEMMIDYKITKRNGNIKMTIKAKNCPIEISHHMLAAMAATEGVELWQITEVELDGGNYAEECFAGRRWNPTIALRGTPKEGKGFETAFASLKKMTVKNIPTIKRAFMPFFDDHHPVEFYADKTLTYIAPEAFGFTRLSKFNAPSIKDENMISEALSPHGEIRPLSESQPGEPRN